MENRVTIRVGATDDLAQVTGLWQELVRTHVALDGRVQAIAPRGATRWQRRLAKLLTDPNCLLVVAETEQHLVGFATGFIQFGPDVFEPLKVGTVADIFVDQDWRRQGIAQRLLAALTNWFRQEAVDHVEMNMVMTNRLAVDFWRGVGARDFTARMWLPLDWQQREQGPAK